MHGPRRARWHSSWPAGGFPGQRLLRSLVLLPLVLPPVVGGIALLYTVRPAGPARHTARVARHPDRLLHHRGGDGADLRRAAVPGGQPRGRAAHGGRAVRGRRRDARAPGPTTVLRRVTAPARAARPRLRRGAVVRPRAGRVRRHPDLRRQPAGRHPHPAAGDLPAARDRPRRRGRAVPGARGGRGGGDRRRALAAGRGSGADRSERPPGSTLRSSATAPASRLDVALSRRARRACWPSSAPTAPASRRCSPCSPGCCGPTPGTSGSAAGAVRPATVRPRAPRTGAASGCSPSSPCCSRT